MRHPDDPTPEPHEYRVYGDDMAQTWVVVDQEDYQWGSNGSGISMSHIHQEMALKDKSIIPWISNTPVKRVIYVKNRLINIVI